MMTTATERLNAAMEWVMEFNWPKSPKTQSDCLQEFLNAGAQAVKEIEDLRYDNGELIVAVDMLRKEAKLKPSREGSQAK